MSPCPNEQQLVDLLEQRLPASEFVTLAAHVEHCEACHGRLARLTDDRSLIEDLPAEAAIRPDSQGLARTDPLMTTDLKPPDLPPDTELASGQPSDPGVTVATPSSAGRVPGGVVLTGTEQAEAPDATGAFEGRPGGAAAHVPPPQGGRSGAKQPDVPGYELIREVGCGGMGVVYLARQKNLDRLVALKMIRDSQLARSDHLFRFRTEAEAIARLRHPNILQIFDVGETEGMPYVALEWLEGGSLSDRIAGTPRSRRESAELVATLARAVQAAHDAGIVHRDLKPANILFDAEGVPKVADFGLAKRLDLDDPGHTRTGQIMGSPSYMAPEQASGQTRDVGRAADVYALGSVLYELLTGRPPFKGASAMETVRMVLELEPVPPSRLRARVPRDLETICLHCLEKNPARRYASATALAEDLERYLAGRPIRARRTPAWEKAAKWARRHPAASVLLLVGLMALGGGAAAWWRTDAARRASDVRESRRLTGVRVALGRELRTAQAAMARDDWSEARALLAGLSSRLEREPALADLRAEATSLRNETAAAIQVQNRRDQDAARLEQFARGRDEALLRDSGFLGDPAENRRAAHDAALTALAVFGNGQPPGKGWNLAALPAELAERDGQAIREGCYELLLVLAGTSTGGATKDGTTGTALAILEDASRLRPPTPALHLRREAGLTRQGDLAGALAAHKAAMALSPSEAFDYYLIGQELYRRNDWRGAERALERVARLEPDHFWAQALLANLALLQGRPTEARAGFSACLNRHPDFAWLYLLRGFAYGESGNLRLREAQLVPRLATERREEAARLFEDAEADYRSALEGRLGEADRYALLVNRGIMRFRNDALAPARSDLEAAAALRPQAYQAHASLAQVLEREGHRAEAEAALARAIEGAPERAELYRSRALLRLGRPDLDDDGRRLALTDLEKAIRLEGPGRPERAGDEALRAELLYRSGRYGETLEAAVAALAIDPAQAAAHRFRVAALLELKRLDEVLAACEAAMAGGSATAELHEVRGLALAGLRDHSGAIEAYTHALGLAPRSAQLLARRGWAYVFAGSPALALQDFERALKRDGKHIDALSGRGFVRASLGSDADAVDDAEAAIRAAAASDRAFERARVAYQGARTYALAAAGLAGARDRTDPVRLARRNGYLSRAATLVRQSIELNPAEEREAYIREVLEPDPALEPLRKRADWQALTRDGLTLSRASRPVP